MTDLHSTDVTQLAGNPQTLDLSGMTIICLDESRASLHGSHSAEQLANLLASYWIPFLDCEECGRSDYCKYTRPHPRATGRLADIRCGVVEAALGNYVSGVFSLLQEMDRRELQTFLDGTYHLFRFIYAAEQQIGLMLSSNYMEFLGEDQHRARFFGLTARLRRHLDDFAGAMRGIDAFKTKTTVILTEGPAEKTYLDRLKDSRLAWFTSLEVQPYYGRGSRRPRKLDPLARRLHAQGYDVFVQGDCDGKVVDIFHQLVRQGIVGADNTFAFAIDFESSFPHEALFDALNAMELRPPVGVDEFCRILAGRPEEESVLKVLERQWSITVDKIELADTLGDLTNRFLFTHTKDDEFWTGTEIGRFLDKIRRLP